MRSPRIALLTLALLTALGHQAAADWSTYLNDNGRTGATAETLPDSLRAAWVYQSPAPPEMAWEGPRTEPIEGKQMRHRVDFDRALQVAMADGRVYFGSSINHQLICRDAKTGQSLWSYFTEGPIRLAPTVADGNVYFGSDDGYVYCLRADDGSEVWKLRVGPSDERLLARGRMISRWPVRTGVLVDQGVAYFGGGVIPHETVYLCAADAATGKLLWKNDAISQADAGRNPLSPQGYLLCSDTMLFVPSGRAMPAAFDRKTGEQVYQRTYSWRSTAGGVVGGSKALLGDGQIYSAGPHHFLALDQKTGAVGFAFIQGRQLSLAGSKAFVADGKSVAALDRVKHAKATVERQALNLKLYALQRKRREMKADEYRKQHAELSGKMDALSEVGAIWKAHCTSEASLIVAGNTVIVGGRNQVEAFDAATGEKRWTQTVEGLASGLAVDHGCLVVSTDRGRIHAFTAAGTAGEVTRYPAKAKSAQTDSLSDLYRKAAADIVKRTGVTRGFCLVLGSEDGRLAEALARQTKLRVYGIEPDAKKVQRARRRLDQAGMYGTRVTFFQAPVDRMPVSNFFANLVVSDSLLLTGKVPGTVADWGRCIKPCGGMVCLTVPETSPAAKKEPSVQLLAERLRLSDLQLEKVQASADSLIAERTKLPGTGAWSHQYGDPANTSTSDDYRVKGGLGVLWYGDPGPSKMVNRHEAAAAPLSTNGRMFIQGTESIRAYDAYNGLFLWEYLNPGAVRTGVFNNEEASNLAASDDHVFVAVNDTCTVLDAAAGEVVATHKTPKSPDNLPRAWGYVAFADGMLFGTSTMRKELAAALRRRGHTVDQATDGIFAIDLKTGNQRWLHRGKNILHVTIAIDGGRVFFIDSSITSEQREALLRQDKSELKKLGPKQAKQKEEELKKLDVRMAVALDAQTGKQLWSEAVDVTDCTRIGIGGGNLTLMAKDESVVICGANANGHYWRQFLSGQFDRRRLVVLDAADGRKLWSKDANYRHRPIIVGQEIYAEPWAFDLRTGKEKQREHPLTGEQTTWQFSRPGHHCGMITATPNMLFFRSGFTGYYDLYSDSGTSHFAGHRLGCWVNAIPGNGLLMIPEASAGCVCQFSLAATIVMEPREASRNQWRIYSATGAQTPVKQLALNLGAPGDRRDDFGTLWLAFPRPKTVGRLEYTFDLKPEFDGGQKWYQRNSESIAVANADTPWIVTSGAEGLRKLHLPLIGKDDPAAAYKVTLHFAELDRIDPGQRQFDVRLQGQTVAAAVDIAKEAGGARQALVRTFNDVAVDGNLIVELVPTNGSAKPPILSAIRVERQ